MSGSTFSQFTPISVLPDITGHANQVLMATGSGASWTVTPIAAGGTGQTTFQAGLDALTQGNLNLSSNGARIRANYSDNTVANRAMFQTSSANNSTNVGIIPNGVVAPGAVATAVVLEDTTSVSSAGSVFRMENVQGTEARLVSTARNGGSTLPMSFYVGNKHTTLSVNAGGNALLTNKHHRFCCGTADYLG